MRRRELLRVAFKQRARYDQDLAPGFRLWLGDRLGGWEFGPYLPSFWRWAVILKGVICILLGREFDGRDWTVDWVELACWDGERHNGYPDADFHSYKCLQVCFGWRPRTWWYAAWTDST